MRWLDVVGPRSTTACLERRRSHGETENRRFAAVTHAWLGRPRRIDADDPSLGLPWLRDPLGPRAGQALLYPQ
jgi:hypothetical protein